MAWPRWQCRQGALPCNSYSCDAAQSFACFRSNIRKFVTLLEILSFLGFKPLPVLGLEVIRNAVAGLCRDIAASAVRRGELQTQLYEMNTDPWVWADNCFEVLIILLFDAAIMQCAVLAAVVTAGDSLQFLCALPQLLLYVICVYI